MTEKTVSGKTVATGFVDLLEGGIDIDVTKVPRNVEHGFFFDSDYGYAAQYHTTLPHWEFEREFRRQVRCLQFYFPGLQGVGLGFDPAYASAVAINRITKPSHMERWALVPTTWQLFGATYQESILTVLRVLQSTYPSRGVVWPDLENLRESQILPNPATEQALKRAAAVQDHRGLLLVPVQVGRCYAGRSVVHVLQELTNRRGREVGFGIIETAIFLLYHPERFGVDYKSLWIDAPGTLISHPDQLKVPFFRVSAEGKLVIKASPVTETDSRSGVATFYV